MDTEGIYNYVKQELADELDQLKQAVLIHEVERYRDEIAGHLKHEVQDWIKQVCEHFDTSMEFIHTKSRRREHVLPRQVIMWGLAIGVVPNKLSLSAMGALFDRDHATALHCRKKISDMLDTEQEFRESIIQLINQFGWRAGYDPETRSFFMQHPAYTLKVAA